MNFAISHFGNNKISKVDLKSQRSKFSLHPYARMRAESLQGLQESTRV